MDDFWTEIQDMPGEIFDITELEENESKMNIQLDEFSNTDYTVWIWISPPQLSTFCLILKIFVELGDNKISSTLKINKNNMTC